MFNKISKSFITVYRVCNDTGTVDQQFISCALVNYELFCFGLMRTEVDHHVKTQSPLSRLPTMTANNVSALECIVL
jgi:hypothetical protein